jgi:hypothetical protein
MPNETDVLPDEGNAEASKRLGEMKERAERDRQKQHWIAFVYGIVFSSVLTVWFLWFVSFVATKRSMDWNLMLMGGTMILPATFVLYLLVSRSGVPRKDDKKDVAAQFPIERLAESIAQLLEAIAGLLKK